MANSFYSDACELDAKHTPWMPSKIKSSEIDAKDGDNPGLYFLRSDDGSKMYGPHSIMNENVAINYRTIYNAYAMFSYGKDEKPEFTEYSDYLRCIKANDVYNQYMRDKRNPTYQNIMKYYSDENFDKHGLAKYRIQDFIYLKYFNQIPNNYMITLRRYTRPCEDHMFGLDMNAEQVNALNGYTDDYFAIATAVTYMGEQTGNKLSDILKYEYGMNWEKKTAQVNSLQNPDGGLAAQLKSRAKVSESIMSGTASTSELFSTSGIKSMFWLSAMSQGKGVSVSQAMASQNNPEENIFSRRYGDQFWGDLNVIQETTMRSRGITFSNNFSLTFEYSLKSLKCVNPRIAMMDILSNFYILTGNYGSFWGGTTIFYGNRNIAPQFGDPNLLRSGKYGQYMNSLWNSVKEGFSKLAGNQQGKEPAGTLESLLGVAKTVLSGGFTALIGNIFGGNIGVAGQSQVVPALLSGAPAGYWHVTVGNPLDPIVMMGNLAVVKTTVQFNDILGYDDFPTEVKFVVELEHCRPRDNAAMENMFNGTKGRFYAFTDGTLENVYHNVDALSGFQKGNKDMTNQSVNVDQSKYTGNTGTSNIKILGAIFNG